MVYLAIRVYQKRFAPPNKVKAKVLHKHTVNFYNKHMPHQTAVRYIVTFEINGKFKPFYVSAGGYNGYQNGQTGTLTYQGDRVVDFG